MIIASVENVKESIIMCVFETTAGRLVVVMAAVARAVVGVLRSRLFADLGAHRGVETVAVSPSKCPRDGRWRHRMTGRDGR